MDPDNCPHDQGTYHDKEDTTFPDVKRCNICDVTMNYSDKEYDGDCIDTSLFWEDDDDLW